MAYPGNWYGGEFAEKKFLVIRLWTQFLWKPKKYQESENPSKKKKKKKKTGSQKFLKKKKKKKKKKQEA